MAKKAPFVAIDHRVRRSGIGPGAFYLYAVIRETAWEVGSTYYRGVDQLAQDCQVTRQTISTWMSELLAVGAISILRNPGPRRNDVITIRDPALIDGEPLAQHRRSIASRRAAKRAGGPASQPDPAVKPLTPGVKAGVASRVNHAGRHPSHGLDDSIEEEDLKNLVKNEEPSPGGSRSSTRGWQIVGDQLVVDELLADTLEVRVILRTLAAAVEEGQEVPNRLRAIVDRCPDPASAVDEVLHTFAGNSNRPSSAPGT